MIKFDRVKLAIGGQEILRSVNLEIGGGEFVVLCGPSGAGKSSVLKLLIGEHQPSAGRIMVDGVDISDLKPKYLQLYRRKIGVVFQDYKLLDKKTVLENIAFALEACEEARDKIEKSVAEILEIVGLSDQGDKFPRQLSGGEQQRVAIARALAHRPALLIADEPTGNLDKANALKIIELLQEINRRGVTVVMTTHQPELLRGLRKLRKVEIEKGTI